MWDANSKLDLREIRCERVGWIIQAEDMDQWQAFMNAFVNLLVP
jgi:hypothetical protein